MKLLFSKKIKKSPFIFLILGGLLLLASQSMAQKITLSGYVRDSTTNEALIGASISIPALKVGAQANTYGFYSITIPAKNTETIIVNFIGYDTKALNISLLQNQTIDFLLKSSSQQLSEVVVSAKINDDNVQKSQMSKIDIGVKQIKLIPTIAGERDVLKVIQFLPGVQSGNEGTTGFYVRGGNIDQNLVLLDEATVYNPNHLFGLFSTFNTNALNNVSLIKGGFPAQYGGRLSSILDISMKDGNNKKFSGEGGIGLLSANLTLEGPIQKNKSSFIVSARRSYIDLLLKPFIPKNKNNTSYFLYDINAKMNYELGKKDHVFLSYFTGLDNAAYTGANSLNYGINFGNSTATFRWNHIYNQKIFSNTSLIYNQYHLGLSTTQNNYYALLYTGIKDLTAKTSLEIFPNPNHSINIGGMFTQHALSPASVSAKIPKKGDRKTIKPDSLTRFYSNELAFYANDEIKISPSVGINIGVRMPIFTTKSANYVRFEPRATMKMTLSPSTSIKAAYSEMNQFLHLIPNSTASLPTDIWIASSALVKPQVSKQVALGLFKNIAGNNIETSVEVYYKTMQNQALFKEGTQILVETNLENQLTFGKGDSYGIEFFVKKNIGKFTGWASYTLSKTTQHFDALNFGKAFPFTYDRRHNLALVASYEANKKWTFSGNFTFTSGGAFTMPTGRIPVFGDGTLYDGVYYDFTGRNNYRFRSYNRLDLSASYHKPRTIFKTKYDSELVFGAYNVYSRLNPYFVYLTTDPATKQPLAKQVSLLPFVPSISYNFKF